MGKMSNAQKTATPDELFLQSNAAEIMTIETDSVVKGYKRTTGRCPSGHIHASTIFEPKSRCEKKKQGFKEEKEKTPPLTVTSGKLIFRTADMPGTRNRTRGG